MLSYRFNVFNQKRIQNIIKYGCISFFFSIFNIFLYTVAVSRNGFKANIIKVLYIANRIHSVERTCQPRPMQFFNDFL